MCGRLSGGIRYEIAKRKLNYFIHVKKSPQNELIYQSLIEQKNWLIEDQIIDENFNTMNDFNNGNKPHWLKDVVSIAKKLT